jgi:hypothetical protein
MCHKSATQQATKNQVVKIGLELSTARVARWFVFISKIPIWVKY